MKFAARSSFPAGITVLLPHLLVIFWLLFLWVTVAQHAYHTVQPPLYDPLGYMQKAMHFWEMVNQGKLVNWLDIEPSVRPPGTILLSYPFGFSDDYRGYYFRSVYVPLICIVAAVYIAAGNNFPRSCPWGVALTAMLFSSIPMFYHFDMVEGLVRNTRWGLVDNFHAGVSALAVAALLRSWFGYSIRWLVTGAFLAAFTLLIKPSGAMVMALLVAAWAAMLGADWMLTRRFNSGSGELKRYALRGGLWIFALYALIVFLCVSSKYLSPENFQYAERALSIMREVLQIPLRRFLSLFHGATGEFLPLWAILTAAGFGYVSRKLGSERIAWPGFALFVCAIGFWIAGAWYWLIVQAGESQIRYFYPFLLMGIICLVPPALWFLERARPGGYIAVACICLLPVANIAALLAQASPSVNWQNLTGVSVSVGEGSAEVEQANRFLDEVRRNDQPAKLYVFMDGVPPAIFENVGLFESYMHPERTTFEVIQTVDWLRGLVVRTDEMAECDYVLIRKLGEQEVVRVLAMEKVDSFNNEVRVFEAALSRMSEESGVRNVSEGPSLRVLKIDDRLKFWHALGMLTSTRQWRSEFVEANSQKNILAVDIMTLLSDVSLGDQYGVVEKRSRNTIFVHPGRTLPTKFKIDPRSFDASSTRPLTKILVRMDPSVPADAVQRGAAIVKVTIQSGDKVLREQVVSTENGMVIPIDSRSTGDPIAIIVDPYNGPDTDWVLVTFE